MTDEYKVKFTVELEIVTSFDSEITADGVLMCLEDDFSNIEEMQCWDIWGGKITQFECKKIEEGENGT